MKIKSLFEY